MFEDSKQPFLPGDDLPKPKPGDTLILKEMEINVDQPKRVRVISTYDTLAESWDPVGENAWTQHDLNNDFGHRGHWYAVVHDPSYELETWSVASWEVERIEGNGCANCGKPKSAHGGRWPGDEMLYCPTNDDRDVWRPMTSTG